MTDSVDHPSHYNDRHIGYECIDLTQFQGFCVGNAMKYLWRFRSKGKPLEDLRKARWYAQRAAMMGAVVLLAYNSCELILRSLYESTTGFERVAWQGFYCRDWHMVIEALDRVIERLEDGKEC